MLSLSRIDDQYSKEKKLNLDGDIHLSQKAIWLHNHINLE